MKNNMRIISFLIIGYIVIHFNPLYAVPLVGLYVFKWTGYELLGGAFFIDMYFGVNTLLPEYTIVVLGMMLAMEWLRPRLMFSTV